MEVIKRDGRKEPFDREKIEQAVMKAFKEVDGDLYNPNSEDALHLDIAAQILRKVKWRVEPATVEEIQDMVEDALMDSNRKDVARAYVRYRYKRELARNVNKLNNSILELVEMKNEELIEENSNKNAIIASTQRDYMAGEVSKNLTNTVLLPPHIREAHNAGIIHFHDADYFAQKIHNCCLVNLEDMLQNGTVINKTLIEKPHTFATACNIATQIMAVVASGQYGGQSISLSHLAPFIDISRQKIHRELLDECSFMDKSMPEGISTLSNIPLDEIVERRLKQEITRGVQTMQYQINTLNTSNGQTPFVTIFMYLNEVEDEQTKKDLAILIEEVLKQRMEGTKNEKGVWITPAFPKLIYVLEEDNITKESPYWYLTELAAKCTAKRMVPDYISEKIMKELKEGNCYPVMGCRSALTVYHDENGKPKFYGRFNQGVVTINLIDVALSAKKDNVDFWELFNERLELCHEALRIRHERLLGTPSDISPIHWQYGALARLEKGEVIDKLLYNGYSTLSLGYRGLWECVLALSGKKLTDPEGEKLGLEIMQKLNDKCTEWKEAENIAYSLYGSPIESTTYKFAKCLKKRFGVIPGITDKDYITNSYHVHVTEPIDIFSKLALESKFQALSPGGAVSYGESANLTKNTDAVLEVMKFIYNNIMYAELNSKSDYCQECGFDGEILIDENMQWYCPNCGNRDHNKLNVRRRTCGYIGSNFWNYGRTEEIKERYVHLGGDD